MRRKLRENSCMFGFLVQAKATCGICLEASVCERYLNFQSLCTWLKDSGSKGESSLRQSEAGKEYNE